MIRAKIAIAGGVLKDTYDDYGLIYLSADGLFAAPTKPMEETTYPEQAGVNVLPETVDDAFDYKVRFLVYPNKGMSSASDVIANFNSKLYTKKADSDIKTFNKVEFHNLYKNCKIVGYPSMLSLTEDFWRELDKTYAIVEWTIRVNDPNLCNFNLK